MPSSFAVLGMVLKRIVNNLNLIMASVVGLVITVTLVSSIPLYSEGMSEALLHRQLTATTDQVQPKSSILLRHFEDQTTAQTGNPFAAGSAAAASSSSSSSSSGSSSSGSGDSSSSSGSGSSGS